MSPPRIDEDSEGTANDKHVFFKPVFENQQDNSAESAHPAVRIKDEEDHIGPTYEHSILPEAVYQEDPPRNAAQIPKEPYYSTWPQEPAERRTWWTRWPWLFIIGILTAVLAGLVGGFIGKSIEGNRHNSAVPNAQASACPSTTASSPTSTTSPSANSQIVIPKTGCPDATGRTFQSSFSNATFKHFCNVDWTGNDIASVYATTISDCVKTCSTVNQYGRINKTCIGATFVPAWANRTQAMQSVDRPSNCFMKYAAEGYPGNKRQEETVVVCLEGKCP
ncbi:uncharacterized protein K460DRAFT_412646 [Cucurbitaria berberidis CBS 394.84]|uniref:Apple domain-containing protein n=1 Tax=Cucurbitaria berberidis CBS 394.84 TaxID=1168544 RepID=A0A9P4GR13_9PLEO|nr:uncharacterized protein K460DRAFT_412646 [Cucurbitaria berberidis CBS 394.84]KAF1851023.1 hypothetical protein K460DRAFT_412646 [Cucurbitaria berberidis CBS 394.84]